MLFKNRRSIGKIKIFILEIEKFSRFQMHTFSTLQGIFGFKSETSSISNDRSSDRTGETYPFGEERFLVFLPEFEREGCYKFAGSHGNGIFFKNYTF